MTIRTQPLLESIFSQKVGRTVRAGEIVVTPVDFVMAHDATLALLVSDFERLSCRVWNPSHVVVPCDHFAPPARIDWADLQKSVLQFADRQQIADVRIYQGICHQLMLEDPRIMPGVFLVGADSHTTLAGAVGCFATGLGATDILGCMATGETWFRVPESIRVVFTGERRPWVMGRDLALHLLGHFGEDGASYRALELWDRTTDTLPMDSRAAICCMAPEMGGKAACFMPDAVTAEYISRRNQCHWEAPVAIEADPDQYREQLKIDVGTLDSLLARPHSPANICNVSEAHDVRIDEIYIGSCAGGRLEDLEMAARLLRGRHVAHGLKVIAVPSSVQVMQQAIALGHLQTLLDAGVCISNPSCGACGGLDKGVLATGDVALTTSTRNFQGRLGPRESFIYLASTAVCAASALTGHITSPAEVWQ